MVRFLVQACFRGPHVVADEVKLAIVFTYFFLLSFFFFLLLLRLLLFTHFGEFPVCEIIFHPIFWHNCEEKKNVGNFYFSTKKS